MTNYPSHSNGMQSLRKEHLYKVLVIGDLGVGKTSIIRRYVHHTYSTNYRATIGVDFALKVLNWDSETVRLQLWDIAGRAVKKLSVCYVLYLSVGVTAGQINWQLAFPPQKFMAGVRDLYYTPFTPFFLLLVF